MGALRGGGGRDVGGESTSTSKVLDDGGVRDAPGENRNMDDISHLVDDDDDADDDDEPVKDEEASEDREPACPKRGKVKRAPKGAKHRRDRNRVNAQNSRAKKEHYIRWLEVKAGLAVTSQGGKDRRDAVEAAWEEKEEEASGAKGVKKRAGDDAVLATPACATKRGRKK